MKKYELVYKTTSTWVKYYEADSELGAEQMFHNDKYLFEFADNLNETVEIESIKEMVFTEITLNEIREDRTGYL